MPRHYRDTGQWYDSVLGWCILSFTLGFAIHRCPAVVGTDGQDSEQVRLFFTKPSKGQEAEGASNHARIWVCARVCCEPLQTLHHEERGGRCFFRHSSLAVEGFGTNSHTVINLDVDSPDVAHVLQAFPG